MRYRLNCENGNWTRARKHFCKDHAKVLWYACYTALHIDCCCEEIADWEDVREWQNIIRKLLDQILKKTQSFIE